MVLTSLEYSVRGYSPCEGLIQQMAIKVEWRPAEACLIWTFNHPKVDRIRVAQGI